MLLRVDETITYKLDFGLADVEFFDKVTSKK
jgi:hypothetical protein